MNETEIYYTDFLKKEDLSGKWHLYWATLNATGIYFRLKKTTEQNDNFEQFIEINPGSRCVLAKRRMYSFRFKLFTGQGCYTLKCDSILQRHRWMYMIELAVNRRPLEPPPNDLTRAVITDATDYNTNMKGIDEEESRNQHSSLTKSSSFRRNFSFKNMRSWKKRNNSLPPTRCVHKKGNLSNESCKKISACSINFAENLAYLGD